MWQMNAAALLCYTGFQPHCLSDWLISPEDKTLIAYELDNGHYRVAFSVECHDAAACSQLVIPPFAGQVLDLSSAKDA